MKNYNIIIKINKMENKQEYILCPSEIPECIDIKILKEYVQKDIIGNQEYFDDLNIPYTISNPKKAEWILHKAISNSKLVGNGNTNVDIAIDNICIDVCVLTLHNNMTNEKSIMQNFSGCDNLDSLFNANQGDEIINIFKTKLFDKYKDINTHIIYFILFVCHKTNIYLSCFKFNPHIIMQMKFIEFTKSHKSINIADIIDTQYGDVKLYKQKKRIELRFKKSILKLECSIKLY